MARKGLGSRIKLLGFLQIHLPILGICNWQSLTRLKTTGPARLLPEADPAAPPLAPASVFVPHTGLGRSKAAALVPPLKAGHPALSLRDASGSALLSSLRPSGGVSLRCRRAGTMGKLATTGHKLPGRL